MKSCFRTKIKVFYALKMMEHDVLMLSKCSGHCFVGKQESGGIDVPM